MSTVAYVNSQLVMVLSTMKWTIIKQKKKIKLKFGFANI